uniref:hypothetical protein n=1 Tax=Prevotella sp. TaxID=59823 RepID=UPI004028F77D
GDTDTNQTTICFFVSNQGQQVIAFVSNQGQQTADFVANQGQQAFAFVANHGQQRGTLVANQGQEGYLWDDGHNLRSQNNGLGGNSDRRKRVRTSLRSSS